MRSYFWQESSFSLIKAPTLWGTTILPIVITQTLVAILIRQCIPLSISEIGLIQPTILIPPCDPPIDMEIGQIRLTALILPLIDTEIGLILPTIRIPPWDLDMEIGQIRPTELNLPHIQDGGKIKQITLI